MKRVTTCLECADGICKRDACRKRNRRRRLRQRPKLKREPAALDVEQLMLLMALTDVNSNLKL